MRHITVPISNVTRLEESFAFVRDNPFNLPRMMLVYGFAGAGKTTATSWLAIQVGAMFLRTSPVWTPSSMLAAIVKELNLFCEKGNEARMEAIVENLIITQRPIFLDDCDQLFNCNQPAKLFEMLRYIHDQANVPMVMVGMDKFSGRIGRWEQLARRVSEHVEFLPLAEEDVAQIINYCLEVSVEPQLQKLIHHESKGSCGRVLVALSQVEAFAKRRNLGTVTLMQWESSGRTFFADKPQRRKADAQSPS
jgi:DNA transposition AAA+ family ATPase